MQYIVFLLITWRDVLLKILHIIDSGGLYGAEVMLLTLAREQRKIGLFPVIASLGEKRTAEKPLEIAAREAGIPVKIFRMPPGLSIRGIRDILAYREAEDFDLIHSHGYKGNILFGFLPARLRKVPIAATLHGWTSSSSVSKMRLYEWLDAKSLSFLDAVAVVNKNMLNHPRFPTITPKKLFTIDNGIPKEKVEDITLDQDIIKFCQNDFVIGTIGRYSPEKGFDVLLQALHFLHKRLGEVKLIVIGDGPCRRALIEQAKLLGISSHVFFTGYRKNADAYMQLMDVYVISSFTEGLPITLLEAMREKVPVIATRVGGIPDVLTHGKEAFLVPPKNAYLLAQSIEKIFEDPKRTSERAENAYEKFVQNYSRRKMTMSYLKLYEQICKTVN